MVRVADISKNTVLVIAGACAAAFAAVLVAIEVSGAFDAPAPSRFSNGPSATTGYMILFGPLSAAWSFSVYVRCSDAFIRRRLIAVAALVAFWMLTVLVKYPMRNDLAVSMLWYCYYIPLVAIPALCFTCALRAAAIDGTRAGRIARAAAAVVSTTFIALVLTNNVHHFVFDFSFANPDWAGSYRYAPGYYALVAWCAALLLAFFATLFLAARAQLRSALVPIGVILGIAAAYSALYILRHVITLASNMSLTYCVLVIVALEIALDLGLLPSYARYADAFAKLPFDLKLLDGQGNVELRSNAAKPLVPSVASAMAASHAAQNGTWTFRASDAPATLFKTYPISGGRALLAEDVSAIDSRRAALESKRQQLLRSNAVLSREAEVQREMWRLRSERELFGEIEASLESKTRRIRQLLDALPQENDAESAARKREMLIEVKLIVAYCKRKGALVLAEKSDPEFDRERLQLVFNETAADLRSIGVDCAALVQTNAPLPAPVVSALYDCLYDFATAANDASDAVLMLFVQEEPHDVLMRAALSTRDAQSERMKNTFESLRRNLAARTIECEIEVSADSATLIARVPLANQDGGTL